MEDGRAGFYESCFFFFFGYISSKDVNVYKGKNDTNKAVDTQNIQ
jgi:hypothetical protein